MNNSVDLSLVSIRQLPEQCQQAWQDCLKLDFPQDYKKVNNIVISGMGGSTFGARMVKSLYDGAELKKIPIELANNYWLPGFVDSQTLVILSSYSGNTEETMGTAKAAKRKGAKILGITSGGQLAQFLKDNGYPGYIFNPVYNPSKQPRIGVGYMVMGLIGILANLKVIPVGDEEVTYAVNFLRNKNTGFAKQLAVKLKDKIPVFIIADFIEGAAYAVRNFFHENAKQFALYFTIPELNHHLMEGLTYPLEIKKFLRFVFVTSSIYDKRNSRRLELTDEIVRENGFLSEKIDLSAKTALTQTWEFIQLGLWITFHLAKSNNVDPAKIPWVDYFKKKLTNGK